MRGNRVPFLLVWHPSNLPAPAGIDPLGSIAETDDLVARVVRAG